MSKKPGRNDPCPCGSGKKYKSCCWAKDIPESDASKKSLFGRVQSAVSKGGDKKLFSAKVLKSGGSKDLVEKTFAESLERLREEEFPPVPPSDEIAAQQFPKDYQKWEPVKND